MPRNERGQFARNDIFIPLPSLSGLYKILIIAILIFPWYAILKSKNYTTTLFSSILGTEYCPDCPTNPKCNCPDCICPKEKPPKFPSFQCPPCYCIIPKNSSENSEKSSNKSSEKLK